MSPHNLFIMRPLMYDFNREQNGHLPVFPARPNGRDGLRSIKAINLPYRFRLR